MFNLKYSVVNHWLVRQSDENKVDKDQNLKHSVTTKTSFRKTTWPCSLLVCQLYVYHNTWKCPSEPQCNWPMMPKSRQDLCNFEFLVFSIPISIAWITLLTGPIKCLTFCVTGLSVTLHVTTVVVSCLKLFVLLNFCKHRSGVVHPLCTASDPATWHVHQSNWTWPTTSKLLWFTLVLSIGGQTQNILHIAWIFWSIESIKITICMQFWFIISAWLHCSRDWIPNHRSLELHESLTFIQYAFSRLSYNICHTY